jgi:hypothetical protein
MEESVVFLLVAVLVGLLTYVIVPRIPTVILMISSLILLSGAIWWHWSQFSVDYRTSTWQESLRQYASYVVLLLVILVSYGVYALFVSDNPVTETVGDMLNTTSNSIRNTTSSMTDTVIAPVTSAISSIRNSFFNDLEDEVIPTPANLNRQANLNRPLNLNRLSNLNRNNKRANLL